MVVVSTYTNLDVLAHQPTGNPAPYGLYVFSLDDSTGGLTLQSIAETVENPAFTRYHPSRNILYTATETIYENGEVYAYAVDPSDMSLSLMGAQDVGGSSTCFLSIERQERRMLFVNYWDSTLGCVSLQPDGRLADDVKLIETKFDAEDAAEMRVKPPKAGEQRKHSLNDAATAAERQTSPHAHSIVLDPALQRIAYVPDLGQDCIHQYLFDEKSGSLEHRGKIPADRAGSGPHGPRYIEFHPRIPVAYVINEMSGTVNVLKFDPNVIAEIEAGASTHALTQVQSIRTVPAGFPSKYNTCGRICVDPTGQYVLVSNRGHDSIAIFRVHKEGGGRLSRVGWCHTRGRTPRHFAFDESGRFVIAANQDSNFISVFAFNPANGNMTHTGKDYVVPSPNFICIKRPYAEPTAL